MLLALPILAAVTVIALLAIAAWGLLQVRLQTVLRHRGPVRRVAVPLLLLGLLLPTVAQASPAPVPLRWRSSAAASGEGEISSRGASREGSSFGENRTSGFRLFLQVDPSGYADSPNLYAGFGNDPVNNRDPTGRQSDAGRPPVTTPRTVSPPFLSFPSVSVGVLVAVVVSDYRVVGTIQLAGAAAECIAAGGLWALPEPTSKAAAVVSYGFCVDQWAAGIGTITSGVPQTTYTAAGGAWLCRAAGAGEEGQVVCGTAAEILVGVGPAVGAIGARLATTSRLLGTGFGAEGTGRFYRTVFSVNPLGALGGPNCGQACVAVVRALKTGVVRPAGAAVVEMTGLEVVQALAAEGIEVVGVKAFATSDEVLAFMARQPPGTSAIVGGTRSTGVGHMFVLHNEPTTLGGSRLFGIDGQVGIFQGFGGLSEFLVLVVR